MLLSTLGCTFPQLFMTWLIFKQCIILAIEFSINAFDNWFENGTEIVLFKKESGESDDSCKCEY